MCGLPKWTVRVCLLLVPCTTEQTYSETTGNMMVLLCGHIVKLFETSKEEERDIHLFKHPLPSLSLCSLSTSSLIYIIFSFFFTFLIHHPFSSFFNVNSCSYYTTTGLADEMLDAVDITKFEFDSPNSELQRLTGRYWGAMSNGTGENYKDYLGDMKPHIYDYTQCAEVRVYRK